MPNQQDIKCPKCGELISIDDVLTRQIEDRVKKELNEENKLKEIEFEKQEREIEDQKRKLEEAQKNTQIEVNRKVAEKLITEKGVLWKQAQVEAEKQKIGEIKFLEEQLNDKEAKLRKASEKELEIRREKNKLEEDKKNFEIEKQRQLDEERTVIAEEASKRANEEQQYVIAQLKKQLTDATKAKDDLARKLEQGSQQTQGEVLELALEEIFKNQFPFDEIVPVPKGVNGVDIIQKVKTNSGRFCGQIAWESKKTKVWNEGWIQKLKDDQRVAKADLAVIVSVVLPEDVNGFLFRDDVWICDVKMALALAMALRINLQNIACERAMSIGKDEKMEALYSYISGVEFQQRVKAIIEAFSTMQDGVKKERLAYEKIWSEREKQIQKVLTNTVGMYGDLSGLAPLPQIKMLELGESEN